MARCALGAQNDGKTHLIAQDQPPLCTYAIVLAGGSGTRFGRGRPKQLAKLAGQPILHHTLSKFDDPTLFARVIVPANVLWRSQIEEIAEVALRKVPVEVVEGGGHRNESVRNALEVLPDQEAKVLVHDGVRPLVTRDLVARVVQELDHARSVLPVIPSADPLVTLDGNRVSVFQDRAVTYRGQSPQGFYLSDLRRAMLSQHAAEIESLSTIFEAVRYVLGDLDIGVVEGESNNLKITLPVDHMVAGRLLLESDTDQEQDLLAPELG